MNTLSLFDTCPLPGCNGLVTDPREPCEDCKAAFGDMLRPPPDDADRLGPNEYAALLADRDSAVVAAYAAQQAAPRKVTGWRRNQRCWVCEQQPRSCKDDPANPGRWICRHCSKEELA